jgi:hypothetical protein
MAIDEERLGEFMGRFVTDMSGAVMMASVMIGDELGLYRLMANSEPTTADELAQRAGCNPRLILEWLNAQAASGYVEFNDGTYRLPEEQALALAVEDSPVFVAPAPSVAASLFLDKDKTVAAMRGNGAMSWGDHHPCLFTATEKSSAPVTRRTLSRRGFLRSMASPPSLKPARRLPTSAAATARQRPFSLRRTPNSTFHGYDFHAPSIAAARERAADAGLSDRITFSQASAKEYTDEGFDLICFFDCLHDMGDPSAQHVTRTRLSPMTELFCS